MEENYFVFFYKIINKFTKLNLSKQSDFCLLIAKYLNK